MCPVAAFANRGMGVEMRGKGLVLAAVPGVALGVAGIADAAPKPKKPPPPQPDNIIEALFTGLGQVFTGEGGAGVQGGQPLYSDQVSRYRIVPGQFRRTTVRYQSEQPAGTIIIDPRQHFLYFILSKDQAIRYGVGVGRTGFGWHGTVRVGSKAEWPGWTPPPQMIVREARRGHKLPAYMKGGIANPLGARALYLHGGGGDTGYRIHGTNEPWTIGLNVSSGCIRLVNDDVVDLYNRARVGAKVIVL